jgi:GNAT superfamily N-acetyltransferase
VLDRAGDIVFLAWEEHRCVGMAMLGGDLAAVPHLGVLVEDDRQRRGIGTRLVTALACEAGRRGVRSIRADILGEDGGLVRRLRRLGPIRVDLYMGTYSVHIDLTATCTAAAPVE